MEPHLDGVLVVDRQVFGRSLEARRAFKAGDEILVQAPAVQVPDQLPTPRSYKDQYSKLSAEQKRLLQGFVSNPETAKNPMSQHLTPEEDHFRRVLHVNGYAYGSLTVKKIALFEHISLANHSCAHNALYCSVASLGVSRLVAAQDIEPGDLITANYIGGAGGLHTWPRWRRQECLEKHFAFTCCCQRCSSEQISGPSSKSTELAKKFEDLDSLFRNEGGFLGSCKSYIDICASASAADDGPYHLFRAWNLVREFHANHYHYQEKRGESHFLPALQALKHVCELMPQRESSVEDVSAIAFAFDAGLKVSRLRPDAKSLRVLQGLWPNLGGWVRDVWGAHDQDFVDICKVFGEPGKRPSVQEAIAFLASACEDAEANMEKALHDEQEAACEDAGPCEDAFLASFLEDAG